MEYILYNYTGYLTDSLKHICATKIQKAYRNNKSYEINRRIDLITHKIPENSSIEKEKEEKEEKEEMTYWNLIRESIKSGYGLIKHNGWQIID